MSMYRLLWLSILLSMLIALGASLFASLYSARAYLEAQLAMKNRDNVTSLALALSREDSGHEDVVLAATALFESGHYQLMQVVDAEGRILLERVEQDVESGAPRWFVALLPIRSLPASAEVASGWRPLGTLTLMSQSRFAYAALWETTLRMSAAIIAAGLLASLLASLVLLRITRPMRAVVAQAQAINERRFVTMPVPEVPELKALAHAMNDMVSRLRDDFEADARRYDTLRREANHDPLTGLANRTFFLAHLNAALEGEVTAYGTLAIIRLRYLGKLNRRAGRDVADELLRRVGQAVAESTGGCTGIFAGRLNGADFALLLPSCCDPLPALHELLLDLPAIAEPLAGEYSTTYIGYASIEAGEPAAGLLARIDETLAGLDSEGLSALREAAPPLVNPDAAPATAGVPGEPVGEHAWREALRAALAVRANLRLARFPILDGAQRQYEFALRLRVGPSDTWLPAGRFLPYAERLGVVPALDLATVELVLSELAEDVHLSGAWINLSAKSLVDAGFRQFLGERLRAHPAEAARLCLEVPEAGGLFRLEALRDLRGELKPLGCRLGLEHFGYQFNRIGELHALGLDFLKVDASFIHDLDAHPGNRAFLAGLCEVAHRIDMRVYAEGVETEAELLAARAVGFDGVTGQAVR